MVRLVISEGWGGDMISFEYLFKDRLIEEVVTWVHLFFNFWIFSWIFKEQGGRQIRYTLKKRWSYIRCVFVNLGSHAEEIVFSLFLIPYFYVACVAQKCFSFMFSCTDSFVKVDVKEINFVTPDVQASATPEFEKKESGGTCRLSEHFLSVMKFIDCKKLTDIFYIGVWWAWIEHCIYTFLDKKQQTAGGQLLNF